MPIFFSIGYTLIDTQKPVVCIGGIETVSITIEGVAVNEVNLTGVIQNETNITAVWPREACNVV